MKSPVIIFFLFSWAQAWGQVIHIQEVYKTVDTCKLAYDDEILDVADSFLRKHNLLD